VAFILPLIITSPYWFSPEASESVRVFSSDVSSNSRVLLVLVYSTVVVILVGFLVSWLVQNTHDTFYAFNTSMFC